VEAYKNSGKRVHRCSGAIMPESWASFPMRYGKDDHVDIICPKDDVEGKPAKDRTAEIGIENLESIRRSADELNQAIQLIQEPNGGANAPLGVPGGGFVGVLLGCRMEADGPSHQPLNRLRSWRRTSSQAMV
jgi:hypothetical protein